MEDVVEHASIFDQDVEARELLCRRTAAGYERHVHAQFEESSRAEKAARAHNARAQAGKFGVGGDGSQQRASASASDESVPAAGAPRNVGGIMEERMAQLQIEADKKRVDARERSRLSAARRMLAQRAARVDRQGAQEQTTLGGAAGVERRLKRHGYTSTGKKLENFEREEVTEAEKETERGTPPPPPEPVVMKMKTKKKKKKKQASTAAVHASEPKVRMTWMSAVEPGWPRPEENNVIVAPLLAREEVGERKYRSHRRQSPSPTPAEVRRRRIAYVAPTPPPSSATSSVGRNPRPHEEKFRKHPAPCPPPDPTSPASLSAVEARRVRDLVAHSLPSSGAVSSDVMPPFNLASLRLLEVAHSALRAQYAALHRVSAGNVLRRWGCYLGIADEEDLKEEKTRGNNKDTASSGEEATRRRLARRMGGMLVAFGAWTAAAAVGAHSTETAAVEDKLLANHVLANLSQDTEKHNVWMKSAVSEWRVYRASWFVDYCAAPR